MAKFRNENIQVYWTTTDNTRVSDGMTVEEVMNGMATIGSSYGFRLETEEETSIRYWTEIMHITPDDLEMSIEWNDFGTRAYKFSTKTGVLPSFVHVQFEQFARASTWYKEPAATTQKFAELIRVKYAQIKAETRLRAEEAHVSMYKHKLGCAYRVKNPTDFACTCQPLTIFGKTRGWFCYMCELPLASEQHGVCAICEPQEYGSHHDVEA